MIRFLCIVSFVALVFWVPSEAFARDCPGGSCPVVVAIVPGVKTLAKVPATLGKAPDNAKAGAVGIVYRVGNLVQVLQERRPVRTALSRVFTRR